MRGKDGFETLMLKEALLFLWIFYFIVGMCYHSSSFFSLCLYLTENSETTLELRVLKFIRAFAAGKCQRMGLLNFLFSSARSAVWLRHHPVHVLLS